MKPVKNFFLIALSVLLFSCNSVDSKETDNLETSTANEAVMSKDTLSVDEKGVDSLIKAHNALSDFKKRFSIELYQDNGKTVAFKGQLKDIFSEGNQNFLLITDARGRRRNYFLSASITDEQLVILKRTLSSGTKAYFGTFIVSNWKVIEGVPILSPNEEVDDSQALGSKVQGVLVDYYLRSLE